MTGPERPASPVPGGQVERPNPLSDPAFRAGLRPIPSGPVEASGRRPAPAITGVDPAGDPVEVDVPGAGAPILLCFLHVRCDGCDEFWRGLRDVGPAGHPLGVDPVVVTRGPGSVDLAEVGRVAQGISLAPVVMSDRAWEDYRVTGYPFFVLVDDGSITGETVGFGWEDVRSMIAACSA